MIEETTWFILIVWVIFLILTLRVSKEVVVGGITGLIGIFLGLILFTEIASWFGLIIIFFNIYVIYRALFTSGGK